MELTIPPYLAEAVMSLIGLLIRTELARINKSIAVMVATTNDHAERILWLEATGHPIRPAAGVCKGCTSPHLATSQQT